MSLSQHSMNRITKPNGNGSMTIWSAILNYTLSKFIVAILLAAFVGIFGDIARFAPIIAKEGDRGVICMCLTSWSRYGPTMVEALGSAGLTGVKCLPPVYSIVDNCSNCTERNNPNLKRARDDAHEKYGHCINSALFNRSEAEKIFGLHLGLLFFVLTFAIQIYRLISAEPSASKE